MVDADAHTLEQFRRIDGQDRFDAGRLLGVDETFASHVVSGFVSHVGELFADP